MSAPDRDRGARASIYNGLTLRVYDLAVLGLTNSLIWRCPTARLVDHYRNNVGASHLDIGPGTGYYLERVDARSISLLDLNESSLAASAERIAPQVEVRSLRQSFFDPLDSNLHFDSIGLNFLMHCIPDRCKWNRLAELRAHLAPGGMIFGSTVVPDHEGANPAAILLNGIYNRLGVFGNSDDTTTDITNALHGLCHVQVDRVGQVVMFSAQMPPNTSTAA